MKFLTPDEIIEINAVVIAGSGGSVGLRDAGLLESITKKPQASFGGQELYPDIHIKAAVLYESLINYHVFVDGNKRTGLAAVARFLFINGHKLELAHEEMVEYPVAVATDKYELAEIAVWIKEHVKQI